MPLPGDGVTVNTIRRNDRTIRYLRITSGPQRDRYVHQLVAEAMLGRPLLPSEEVDHLDQDTLNNDWRNLLVRTVSDHAKVTRTRATMQRLAVQAAEGALAYQADRAARRDEEGYTPECDD